MKSKSEEFLDKLYTINLETYIENFCENEKMRDIIKQEWNEDLIKRLIFKAYGDAKRTMNGIGRADKMSSLSENENTGWTHITKNIGPKRIAAWNEMTTRINKYFKESPPTKEDSFDSFHKKLCNAWTERFLDSPTLAAYGKAQKIVNMTFKYLYCWDYYNEKQYKDHFVYCHLVLDSYTLDWIREVSENNGIKKSTVWSSLKIEEYSDIIRLSREIIPEKSPLTLLQSEFIIWDYQRMKRGVEEWGKLCSSFEGRITNLLFQEQFNIAKEYLCKVQKDNI